MGFEAAHAELSVPRWIIESTEDESCWSFFLRGRNGKKIAYNTGFGSRDAVVEEIARSKILMEKCLKGEQHEGDVIIWSTGRCQKDDFTSEATLAWHFKFCEDDKTLCWGMGYNTKTSAERAAERAKILGATAQIRD